MKPANPPILTINGGSSTIKFALFEARPVKPVPPHPLRFVYQVKRWIGVFVGALGGLDPLVFAGGIGESASAVRAWICDGLGFLEKNGIQGAKGQKLC
jgi:acetate kinase